MGKILRTIGVVCMLLGATITASFAQSLERIRVGIHTNMTQIVLDVRGDADLAYEVAGTGQGKALLIAFPKVSWNAPKILNAPKGVVSGYRFKAHSDGGALAITTSKPIKIKRSLTLPASGRRGARIVFDLVDGLAMPAFSPVATQHISPAMRPTPKRMIAAQPTQLTQAAVVPQEPWLKNWLSAPVPGKGSSGALSGKQGTFRTPQAPHIPQAKPTYSTPYSRPYSQPTPTAAPMPIGATAQGRPQVPDSLAPKYQLPLAAKLDPLQHNAQSAKIRGPFIGVNFGASFLDHKINSATDTAAIEANRAYFKVFGGYRYTRFYSLEFFYGDLGGDTGTSVANDDAEADISAGGVAFKVGYPILEQMVPFAKVGVVAFHADSKIGGEDEGGWSTRSYFGAGIDFWFTPNIGIRGEYENYALNNDTVSAGMMYKF
jgi:hypothetical protein